LILVLVALPLFSGLQKEDRNNPGQNVPWTEPSGELRDVLDRQRRALIGNQLGVIDLQQPEAVALVSFDYTTATRGEMQPLAEAVLGRLKGQGMRIITVSLEPEGAVIAEQTLRGSDTNMVKNLGYIPGQVAGIRNLLTDGGSLESAGWQDVQSLKQVSVIVTLADNAATARGWIEQVEAAAVTPDSGERLLLAATSAAAEPFLRPYRSAGQLDDPNNAQLDGLISGINGAAALEAVRNNFGPARQMLDSQSIAHLLIVILIAAGTMAGWMPPAPQVSGEQAQPEKPGPEQVPDK
jgi:hypothetical protein